MSIITDKINSYSYAMAIWTDKADFIVDKKLENEGNLLEIRCFDERGEFRAFRGVINEEFKYREITDDETYADGFYEESQYLDIDSDKTCRMNNGFVYAIGGGRYHLPVDAKNKKMLLTKIYYKFDDEGVAHKCDWRLVGFTDEETVGKGDNNGN